MNKFLMISVLLFVAGIIFFGLAFYCYHTILDIKETLAYYGIRVENITSGNTVETLAKLKFAIIKFSILGLAAWISGFILFIKRNSKLLHK